MYIGKVIGNIVSTKKEETLIGYKLLIVQKLNSNLIPLNDEAVVADYVGAGSGDYVLVGTGSAIRVNERNSHVCIDAAIVGIIDSVDI